MPVTASPSAKITSPAMPSASKCLVADLGVVGALKAPFVLPLPLLDILAVHLLDHRPVFVAGLEPLVELCVYGALEVGA